MYMTTALCTALESFASTFVRTEPRATSAVPEEKKRGTLGFRNVKCYFRCPRGSVGILVSLTDCRWWFDSPLVRE